MLRRMGKMIVIPESNVCIHFTDEGNESCVGQRRQRENVMQTVGRNSAGIIFSASFVILVLNGQTITLQEGKHMRSTGYRAGRPVLDEVNTWTARVVVTSCRSMVGDNIHLKRLERTLPNLKS